MLSHAQLVSAGEEKRIRIWSIRTGECLSVLEGEPSPVCSLCSWRGAREGVDYDVIFSGARDGTIRVWDRIAGQCSAVCVCVCVCVCVFANVRA
jgi:WD40 repeat protein